MEYKIFSNVLYSYLLMLVKMQIGTQQCGFIPGKSTIDQIFNLRQILECIICVFFKAGYDSISTDQLYQAVRELGILQKLIRLVRITMTGLPQLQLLPLYWLQIFTKLCKNSRNFIRAIKYI